MSAPETPGADERPDDVRYSDVYTSEVLQTAAWTVFQGSADQSLIDWGVSRYGLDSGQELALRAVLAELSWADLYTAVQAAAERLIERESGGDGS